MRNHNSLKYSYNIYPIILHSLRLEEGKCNAFVEGHFWGQPLYTNAYAVTIAGFIPRVICSNDEGC